jgi:predicted dithiol-disulfide oxidoreductase (DUF899 family)
MTEHTVGTREEWLQARKELLKEEKELIRRSGELTEQRRKLPWVKVEKEYRFETEEGTTTLAELFDGRSQLLAYHLMFGPDWTAACPGCSSLADHLDPTIVYLNQHDVTMICISHAPLEKVQAYKRRMGWKFPYVSSFGSDFNFDFHVSFTEEQRQGGAEYNFEPVDFDKVVAEFGQSESIVEAAASCGTDLEGYVTSEGPGLTAFALEDGVVYHTYTAYAPESDFIVGSQQILDRAPREPSAGFPILRRDELEDAAAGTTAS